MSTQQFNVLSLTQALCNVSNELVSARELTGAHTHRTPDSHRYKSSTWKPTATLHTHQKYKKTIASLSPSPPGHCSLNHHFLLTGPVLPLATSQISNPIRPCQGWGESICRGLHICA